MTRLAKTLWLPAALSAGLTFIAGSAFAGECDPKYEKCPPPPPCDPYKEKCPPPKKVTADCSPGYYKKHPEEWCRGYVGSGSPSDPDYPGSDLSKACASGAGCTVLLQQLNDHTPVLGAGIRQGAKSFLDACFVTAAASPCEDDD
jgi:hypothetical protein